MESFTSVTDLYRKKQDFFFYLSSKTFSLFTNIKQKPHTKTTTIKLTLSRFLSATHQIQSSVSVLHKQWSSAFLMTKRTCTSLGRKYLPREYKNALINIQSATIYFMLHAPQNTKRSSPSYTEQYEVLQLCISEQL